MPVGLRRLRNQRNPTRKVVMRTVAASEFSRNFGRYQDRAIREPIRVTSHGRVVGAYISAEELERY